jgi:cysteinyl-tRNA synthetase
MAIRFYDSLTKKTQEIKLLHDGVVNIYNCGPTVYKRPHLGNMRRFLFADFLRRSLEFMGLKVIDVTNLTDVGHLTQDDIDAGEDKLELEARQRKLKPQDIASEVTKLYFQDLDALNIKRPAHSPRATDHIKEMQMIIQMLLERGHAYKTKIGVFFDVTTFPRYGELSGNSLEKLALGKRLNIRQEKRHPADFALWQTHDPSHLQMWDSPWGRGYPGWHIECSAMSWKFLGERLDIHTGGIDNKFPHHENEIAQSEGAWQQKYANLWLHNAHLNMGGQKIAKREGEQLTVSTLQEQGISPLAFRLLVFGAHYRTPLDFSWEAAAQAQETLETCRQFLRRGRERAGVKNWLKEDGQPDEETIGQFRQALVDDLNTPRALAVLMDYMRTLNKIMAEGRKAPGAGATLKEFDRVLGLLDCLEAESEIDIIPAKIQRIAARREQARREHNFARADELRDKLSELGYAVEDTPAGPRVKKMGGYSQFIHSFSNGG